MEVQDQQVSRIDQQWELVAGGSSGGVTYQSCTTVGPSLVALSSLTNCTSSRLLMAALCGFGQQGAT